jgi:hypothetical protein
VIFVPPPDREARAAILGVLLSRESPTRESTSSCSQAEPKDSPAPTSALVDRTVEAKLRASMRRRPICR